jgi:hypothetical protein
MDLFIQMWGGESRSSASPQSLPIYIYIYVSSSSHLSSHPPTQINLLANLARSTAKKITKKLPALERFFAKCYNIYSINLYIFISHSLSSQIEIGLHLLLDSNILFNRQHIYIYKKKKKKKTSYKIILIPSTRILAHNGMCFKCQ